MNKHAATFGLTYADMPGFGDGHKSPALEFEKILKASKYFDPNRDRIDLLPRKDFVQGVNIPSDNYDMVFTSGWGAVTNTGKLKSPNGALGLTANNLKYKHLLNFNPDIPFNNNELNTPVGHPNELNLIFGKDTTKTLPNSWYTGTISPLTDKDVVKSYLAPLDRNKVFDELEQYWQNIPMHDPNYNEHIKDLPKKLEKLNKLRNKKAIGTISGSGMGTYVSQRAIETGEALNNLSNADDFGFIALRGSGQKDPKVLAQASKKYNNILVIDEKLPRDLFTKLQRIADVHWGSSGAASFSESLLADNIYALPKEWGAGVFYFDKSPNTLAGRQHLNLKKLEPNLADEYHWYHGQDNFNEGQLSLFKNQKGVVEINTGDDFVKTLNNPTLLNSLKPLAAQRAGQYRKEYFASRQRLENLVDDYLKGYNRYATDALGAGEDLSKAKGKYFKNLVSGESYSKVAPYLKAHPKTKLINAGNFAELKNALSEAKFNNNLTKAVGAAVIGGIGTKAAINYYNKNNNR